MSFFSAVFLAVGISLFVFGMLLIKYTLKENFGEKMKYILSGCTKNRFSAVFTGAFVTFAMQSSSASSVLTAAFVDNGYLSTDKAFWIIVGANAGTAFTGLITATDMTKTAPALCIIGVALLSFTKKKKTTAAGLFLTGSGLLFVGMKFMSDASDGIGDSAFFAEVLSACSSPVSGILAGMFFTALIQSSSAVTALLQVLAADGLAGIRHTYYIILGSNIGTCTTCAISCAGLSQGAKTVAYMHIIYNAVSSVLFLVIALFLPLPEFIEAVSGGNIKTAVALINIIVNTATVFPALLVPVNKLTVR